MEQFTWLQIGGTLLGAITVGVSLIPALSFIAAQVKERRARKEAQTTHNMTSTVESRRLVAEEDERNRIEALRISDFYKAQWENGEKRIKSLEGGNSLSHATITKFYVALHVLRKQIDILDLMYNRGASAGMLETQIETVKQKWDEVDAVLKL